MNKSLEMNKWRMDRDGSEKFEGRIFPEIEITYDFENTCDFRAYECIAFDVFLEKYAEVTFEITAVPLEIARPEFFPKTTLFSNVCGEGLVKVELDFSQFDNKKMVAAFWRYISQLKIKGHSKDIPALDIKNICLKKRGVFSVTADIYSKVSQSNESITYPLTLENLTDKKCLLRLDQLFYGRESMVTSFEKEIALEANQVKTVQVCVELHDNIPAGGFEKQLISVIPNGNVNYKKDIEFITAVKRPHPYIMHTQKGWNEVKDKIANYPWAKASLLENYVEPSKRWEVPKPSENGNFIFPSYSQEALRQAAIAWKLTGEKAFGEKAALYLKHLSNPEKGYLSTQTSYFVFIENSEEYKKGNFKEHRACSAGWIQEAEFFIQVAIAYDLLYDTDFLSAKDHENMEAMLRSYINFMDWLLTDGDGNNFQVGEMTAALLCSMVLQDYSLINRFIYGYNGYRDLLASVFLDDGIYFELATSYMYLGTSLFFEAANAAENFGIPLKNMEAQACYNKDVLLSPWALRHQIKQDKKPFLGMNFERFGKIHSSVRTLKACYDSTLRFVNYAGMMFSSNDSNEFSYHSFYEQGYYLYRDENYIPVIKASAQRDLIFGVAELPEVVTDIAQRSHFADNAGFAVLRSQKEGRPIQNQIQLVIKYGTHGGYHGHFDRISLLSLMRDNETYHNTEYTWFGYTSFLFKMWVQTSFAHNMVTVDQRMQEPTPCEKTLFYSGNMMQAVCVQTNARWCDPPYGGQTPYLDKFPEEKCKKEGRYILEPPYPRKQGDIGEYSEPVFQRRLAILTDDYVLIWDYLESEQEHEFDCLFHPKGACTVDQKSFKHTERFNQDAFGAAQFVTNCDWYRYDHTAHFSFTNTEKTREGSRVNYISHTDLYGVYPDNKTVIIGKYPEKEDTFTQQHIKNQTDLYASSNKKTVSFHSKGKSASYISLLEVYNDTPKMVVSVEAEDFDQVKVILANGNIQQFTVLNMNQKDGKVSVSIEEYQNSKRIRSEQTN